MLVGILIGSVGILIGFVGILIGSVGILIHWYFEHWYFERWYFEPLPSQVTTNGPTTKVPEILEPIRNTNFPPRDILRIEVHFLDAPSDSISKFLLD